VRNSLHAGKTMQVPGDQRANPTLARNIAFVVADMIRQKAQGVYHIVGREEMDKYTWALKIAEYFRLDQNLLAPVATEKMGQKAARPLNCTLSCGKAEEELNAKLFSLKEAFTYFNDQKTSV